MTGLTRTTLAFFLLLLAGCCWALLDAARADDAVRSWPDRAGPALSVSYLEPAGPVTGQPVRAHPGLRPIFTLDFVYAP